MLDIQQGRGFTSSVDNATVVSYVYDPQVLTRDLERDYAHIEDRGIPVIRRLSNFEEVSSKEREAMVAFLDMHLDRAGARINRMCALRLSSSRLGVSSNTQSSILEIGFYFRSR